MLRKNILTVLLLSGLSFLSQAQYRPGSYDARWKAIDSLNDQKGLTESALAEVNKVYVLARQEKNDVQMIRALIYRIGLEERKKQDALPEQIKTLEKEVDSARQPARSILESLLAEAYWDYFLQNRYKLYDRTNTTGVVKTDIATWTAEDFGKKVGGLYLSSVQNEKALQAEKLDKYDPIIRKGTARFLRPTLFDLLGHRALEYFKSSDYLLRQPTSPAWIDDPVVFSDAADFAAHPFVIKDSLAFHPKALRLFQRLIRWHLSDARTDALLDVDIERLQFVYGYATMDNKDTLYEQAVNRLTDRYGNAPFAARAWYLKASIYAGHAGRYDPFGDTTHRYDYLPAKAICEKVLAGPKDSSEGRSNCVTLLREILRKTLLLKLEKVNVPDKPLRCLVSWRNISQLYLRLVRLDSVSEHTLPLYMQRKTILEEAANLPVLRSWTQPLPVTGDNQPHRTEIAIEGLPPGSYLLLASSSTDFSPENQEVSVGQLRVSHIATIANGRDYFVLDRTSGRPLPGAVALLWKRNYNNRTNHYDLEKIGSYMADKDGHFNVKSPLSQGVVEVILPGDRDHLLLTDDYVPYFGSEEAEPKDTQHLRTFLFTDRSIYRPGQTVWFKGIVLSTNEETRQTNAVGQFKTIVYLQDVNGQKVDSLSVVSNEFGSYQGKFRIPEHLLNGQFSLVEDSTDARQTFSVEEYKRPTFYVEYDKLKGSHRVGDSIRVTGMAKAYAGNPVDGAMVRYRVVRVARFPYPWLYGRRTPPTGGQQELAHGEIKTGANGKFSIGFVALPNPAISKALDPLFDYSISADITDINGETRSESTIVTVGYKTLQLSMDIPGGDHQPADSLKRLAIRITNLSGEPEDSRVHVALYPLQTPGRLIRERLWEEPDQFILTEKAYLDSFPLDEYSHETKKESWKKGAAVFQGMDTAGVVQLARLSPGWYVVEAITTDRYGQPVKDIQYVELYDSKTGSPAMPQYNWDLSFQQTRQPGETAVVGVGTSADNVYVIRTIDRGLPNNRNAGGSFSSFVLNKESKQTLIPVTEADRGGFGVSDIFIKDNRQYTHFTTVTVPWTNKDLDIHYTTYRDKTEPGSKERWQVRISGYKGEKVASEILTSMYDASLDQFSPQAWFKPNIYPPFIASRYWTGGTNSIVQSTFVTVGGYEVWNDFVKTYDQLLPLYMSVRFGAGINNGRVNFSFKSSAPQALSVSGAPGAALNYEADATDIHIRGINSIGAGNNPLYVVDGKIVDASLMKIYPQSEIESMSVLTGDQATAIYGTQAAGGVIVVVTKKGAAAAPEVQVRRNFNETAFFFPDLRTDSLGNVSFSFTMPEAVTRWKWMTLAHTKDAAFGYSEKTIVTQKQLMVQPNAPRFLREGDRMELGVKVVNLTDSEMTGQMNLQLIDPTTGQTADGWFTNRQANQYFTVGARQSAVVAFPLDMPYQYNRPLTYRVVAQAGNYSDGEEAMLPVVSNRMLVTETLPLNLPGDGTKSFRWEKLLQSGQSETLNHHALTVEFTANPAWYAVEALPYLAEYPYECAEQTFNRWYANALAGKIAGSTPRLQRIFDSWRTRDTAALLSNLQKNQELKSVLLEETPWVLQGKTEAQQRQQVALLFDMSRMSKELTATLDKLKGMQTPGGGFVWFKGGPDDRYITQYILTGIGHLQKLQAIPSSMAAKVKEIVGPALAWLDDQIRKDYERDIKRPQHQQEWLGELPVQYLYMRTLFSDYGIPGNVFPAVNYYRKKAQRLWLQGSRYMQGMVALALFRTGDVQTARDIMSSLKQNAIRDEEKGMYWKGMEGGYYWYQAPVEIQSLMIEAFHDISGDATVERDLKTWLLKQKQTHHWPTTKATTDACYALLLGGTDWLSAERTVSIRLGDKAVEWGSAGTGVEGAGKPEAGTGYYKKIFDGPFVNPGMGNITVTMRTQAGAGAGGTTAGGAAGGGKIAGGATAGSPAWGAVYWQYFDNLDRITAAEGNKAPLKLTKKLFIEHNTDKGPVLEPVSENGTIKVGDKIKVRIELQADRDLEYVHMKDMRAACMEPVNVISEYKWQGGLGYYESTKDASTDFFFSALRRGTYVFEYTLFVQQVGNFSNGITSIECMYAPEFAFHSEGIRVNVEVMQ